MRLDSGPQTFGGVRHALTGQSVIGDGEAATFLAKDVFMRHPKILHLDLGRIFGRTQGVHHTGDLKAGPISLDDEGGNTGTPRPASPRKDQPVIRPIGAANPQLGAVQDPMVIAITDRPGLDGPGRVTAARGF